MSKPMRRVRQGCQFASPVSGNQQGNWSHLDKPAGGTQCVKVE
jgi:hypothetical protein